MSLFGRKSVFSPIPALSAGLSLCAAAFLLGMTGCRDGGATASGTSKRGAFLGKVFSGGKNKETEPESEAGASKQKAAQPRRIPIGTVHLVNSDAKFVLIKSSRTLRIPEGADLFSYAAVGIPSGKLKLSAERKGAFLVADIIGGNPQANEVVMFFGIEGSDGELAADHDPAAPQVLE
jgi:hypothetical protein